MIATSFIFYSGRKMWCVVLLLAFGLIFSLCTTTMEQLKRDSKCNSRDLPRALHLPFRNYSNFMSNHFYKCTYRWDLQLSALISMGIDKNCVCLHLYGNSKLAAEPKSLYVRVKFSRIAATLQLQHSCRSWSQTFWTMFVFPLSTSRHVSQSSKKRLAALLYREYTPCLIKLHTEHF